MKFKFFPQNSIIHENFLVQYAAKAGYNMFVGRTQAHGLCIPALYEVAYVVKSQAIYQSPLSSGTVSCAVCLSICWSSLP